MTEATKTGLRINPERNTTAVHVDGRHFKSYNETGTRAEALRIAELWAAGNAHTVMIYVNENGIPNGPYTLDELRQAVASVPLAKPANPTSEPLRVEKRTIGGTKIELALPDRVFVQFDTRNAPTDDLGSLGYVIASVWYQSDKDDRYLGKLYTDVPGLWTASVAPRSGGVKAKDRDAMPAVLGTAYRTPSEALDAITRYHKQAGTIANG